MSVYIHHTVTTRPTIALQFVFEYELSITFIAVYISLH
jgi:hypothetical protein